MLLILSPSLISFTLTTTKSTLFHQSIKPKKSELEFPQIVAMAEAVVSMALETLRDLLKEEQITMILLFSITLPIILIFYLLHKTKTPPKTPHLPPGPPPLPLIGNLHHLAAAPNLHLYLHQLTKKYGPIIHMKLGPIPLLVVSSPKLAKEVLKNQDSTFCSRPKSLGQQKLSYNNSDIIFSPYNEYCKEMRKITTIHLLSPKKVQSFRPIREDEISRMISKIREASDENRAVNMSEMAISLGINLICKIAFGKECPRRFDELLEEVQAVAVAFYVSDYFPAFGWVDKLTGMIGRLDSAVKKMDSFYQELIDEHLDRKRVKEVEEEDGDVLDVLIQLKMQHKIPSIDFGWDNIKAILMDIFIAGAETSSSAIIWTMTALMKSPNNIKQKLQNEIRSLVGEKGKVDEDDLPKLPYLRAVVNESMRLYPPGPLLIPRETIERCTLEGYQIQPKTMVFVNAWAIARDPEYWENPDEFVPERFLNSVKGKDFEFLPFGAGRRICPGMAMGLLNVELTLANLLYSFDWGLPIGVQTDDVDTTPSPGLAMQKKTPLLVVPKNYMMFSSE
ncbi:6,7,8-trihydroxycoumarin synthase-like [Salvia miltiorrhiza]|uniref:6,7,8-trihydroxycoumarin synthase-like n=1 Tax=Salvia miltiorrhiza TaxID=226208 RepID=UPI0025AC0F93|nr:6,7,8-trihydroxycoumarin synthase-like [Salvia miltiorrhiza]